MSSFNSHPSHERGKKVWNPKRSETFHELLSHSFLFINLAVIYHCLLRLSAFISFLYPFFPHNIPACQMSRKIWKMTTIIVIENNFPFSPLPSLFITSKRCFDEWTSSFCLLNTSGEHEYAGKYLLLPCYIVSVADRAGTFGINCVFQRLISVWCLKVLLWKDVVVMWVVALGSGNRQVTLNGWRKFELF